MVRTGMAAQRAALDRVGGMMPRAGRCLEFTRGVFGVGPRFPSAISAWDHAQLRHTDAPPRGAVVPVFFETPSPFRHVAVALGNGKVVSTNGAKISLWADVGTVARVYRGPYLGWSEDLNGVRVFRADGPRTLAVTGVWADLTTRALQRRFGTTVDGTISGQTITGANRAVHGLVAGHGGSALVSAMQEWLGIARDGRLDGDTIRALQRRFGTQVDGTISAPSSNLVAAMQRALDKKASILPVQQILPDDSLDQPPVVVPVPDDVLPDGSTLPVDPDDLGLDLDLPDPSLPGDDADSPADDPAAADAPVDEGTADDTDPALDPDHDLASAPQDPDAPPDLDA